MKNNVQISKKCCKGCSEEYESRSMVVIEKPISLDRGYCPACRDKLRIEEENKIKAAQQMDIVKKRREWRNKCGIPPKFMEAYFNAFEEERQQKALTVCLDYADKFSPLNPQGYPSLVLFSEKSWGTGKTHLVCAIAHHLIDGWSGEDIGRPVLFISEPDLFRRIQATYSIRLEERGWRETEGDVFRELTSVPILILDDIGKEERADPRFVQRVLYSIIDGRYKNMLPIVLTANLNQTQLMAHLGGERGNEAAFDRLLEMCGGKFYQLEGESYRRQIRK